MNFAMSNNIGCMIMTALQCHSQDGENFSQEVKPVEVQLVVTWQTWYLAPGTRHGI